MEWPAPLEQLLGGAQPSYELLEERISSAAGPARRFRASVSSFIKHALTREVAYASLPKARRAKLHASLAQWMERSREARDEYAGILGHHYAEAVRPEDADLAWAGADDELEELRAERRCTGSSVPRILQ